MNITDYLRTALLNHALAVAVFVPPSGIWAGIYTAQPNNTGGGTEVDGFDYSRVRTTWNAASLGTIHTALDIRFPASGVSLSDWGTVAALGLFDSSVNGNLLFYGLLSAPVDLSTGHSFDVAPSNLSISLS